MPGRGAGHPEDAYAPGPFAVDFETRTSMAALREERLARAVDGLRAARLDALLLFKNENVRFCSGLRAQIIQDKSSLLNGCMVGRDGHLVLLLSGGELDRARRSMPWVDEMYAIPILEDAGLIEGAVEHTIAPLLSKLGGAAVGTDHLPFALLDPLRRHLPRLSLHDGDAVMREAAAIAEAVTEAAIRAVVPGVREWDVVAEAMAALHRLGGETAHLATPFVASGERMSPPARFASDKLIREGDIVFVDIGAMFNGYYADLGRTVVCGLPNRKQQEIFTAVHHALQAGIAAMRPGNSNVDVAGAVVDAVAEHGLSGRLLSLFIGHGVGVGANEPPYIGETLAGAPVVDLAEGMVFALEPLVWIEGVRGGGGVRLEDTVAVGPDEGIPLTRTAFDDRLLL